MKNITQTIHLKTISQLHGMIGVAKPKHPLFSLLRFEELPLVTTDQRLKIIADYYQITLKTECPCKVQYGQNMFDFDEGVISCFAPSQVSILDKDFSFARSGWLMSIHPDFLRAFPLNQKIKNYGFFDYAINEALILSEEEQQEIEKIFGQIEKEYYRPIDNFSQELVIAFIDVLLSFFNRYYTRQFIMRKVKHNDMLIKIEEILNESFRNNEYSIIPSAKNLAERLNLSPKYLSDCLKQLTGQTTQQLIHGKIIEQAKDLLSGTKHSVSEIAYRLGFEYSQSFNKLFKAKTTLTPMEFRQTFN
jgi:AraC family transcriptional activator of pobA